jgi:hypothetical protein
MKEDLTQGTDGRGDNALFIDSKHFIDGWELDAEAQKKTQNLIFFRVIENGFEQSGHGWAENGVIIQWG